MSNEYKRPSQGLIDMEQKMDKDIKSYEPIYNGVNILNMMIDKFEKGVMKLYDDDLKKKYVYMKILRDYPNIKIIKDKCLIEPCEEDGYTIKIYYTYPFSDIQLMTFDTWINGTHSGYGDKIISNDWNSTPYLNFDNKGNEIEFKEKTLIKDFIW